MEISRILNQHNVFRSAYYQVLLPVVSFALIALCTYLIFMVVPNEQVMGAVQRIFYFHVASAFASYFMLALVLIGSISFLVTSDEIWDAVSKAAASVALVFSSIVLATGMIWGHSAWNTWWRWEPRLVSFLVLWLLLLSYAFLRSALKDHPKLKRFAAVVGVVAALQVPIVIYSVKLLDHSQQLHPEVVAKQGLRDSRYVLTFALSGFSLILFSLWLFVLKVGNVFLETEIIRAYRRSA